MKGNFNISYVLKWFKTDQESNYPLSLWYFMHYRNKYSTLLPNKKDQLSLQIVSHI